MPAWTALLLLQRFQALHGLTLPGVEKLAGTLHAIELRPREAAFIQDVACPYVYVVRSGLLKQVYTEEDGSEWIKSFAGPGDMFACLMAISGQSKTSFASVAIEHSVVERIDYRLIETMAETSLAWQKAVRIVFQRLAELKVQRERDLLTLTARELYRKLARSAPQWVERVPQKDLAGFLGVTPVGLNRIVRDELRARSIPADRQLNL
ncbi:MAG: Crp/Fnr family transcriptional regulator [Burkholderiales bacterium]